MTGVGAGRAAVKGGANDGQIFSRLCLPSVLRRPQQATLCPPAREQAAASMGRHAGTPGGSRSALSICLPNLARSPRKHRPPPRRARGQAGRYPPQEARPSCWETAGRERQTPARAPRTHAHPGSSAFPPAPRGATTGRTPAGRAGRGGPAAAPRWARSSDRPGGATAGSQPAAPGRPRSRCAPTPGCGRGRAPRRCLAFARRPPRPPAAVSHLRAPRSARAPSARSAAGVQRRPDLSALAPPRSGPAPV